jgi:hypothetical protein
MKNHIFPSNANHQPSLESVRIAAAESKKKKTIKEWQGVTLKSGPCALTRLPPDGFRPPLFGIEANGISIRGAFTGPRGHMPEPPAFARARGDRPVE